MDTFQQGKGLIEAEYSNQRNNVGLQVEPFG